MIGIHAVVDVELTQPIVPDPIIRLSKLYSLQDPARVIQQFNPHADRHIRMFDVLTLRDSCTCDRYIIKGLYRLMKDLDVPLESSLVDLDRVGLMTPRSAMIPIDDLIGLRSFMDNTVRVAVDDIPTHSVHML